MSEIIKIECWEEKENRSFSPCVKNFFFTRIKKILIFILYIDMLLTWTYFLLLGKSWRRCGHEHSFVGWKWTQRWGRISKHAENPGRRKNRNSSFAWWVRRLTIAKVLRSVIQWAEFFLFSPVYLKGNLRKSYLSVCGQLVRMFAICK